MIRPSKSPVTAPYGYSPGYQNGQVKHTGVDFAHSPDDKIYMPEDGIVTVVPWNGTSKEGNAIYINVGNRRHLLGHISKFLVSNGQMIMKGHPIAIMGETGYAFGIHLHWGLSVGGVLVDPLTLVTEGNDMYEGKTAEQWANEAKANMNVATIREGYLNRISVAAGEDYDPVEGDDVDRIIANIDAKNKRIVALEQENAALANPTPLKKGIYKVQ